MPNFMFIVEAMNDDNCLIIAGFSNRQDACEFADQKSEFDENAMYVVSTYNHGKYERQEVYIDGYWQPW